MKLTKQRASRSGLPETGPTVQYSFDKRRYRLHEDSGRTGTWNSAELYATSVSEIRQAVIAGFRCGMARWATIRSTVVYKLDASGTPSEACQ